MRKVSSKRYKYKVFKEDIDLMFLKDLERVVHNYSIIYSDYIYFN